MAAMAGTGGAGGGSRQETVLACLARQSSDLAPNCKSELQVGPTACDEAAPHPLPAPFSPNQTSPASALLAEGDTTVYPTSPQPLPRFPNTSRPVLSPLQSLVKLSLSRYRVGMPLTAQCDGDVLARCNVDKLAAPFVEPGYVLGCLAKHAAKLHKPCWELISSMDDGCGEGPPRGRRAGAGMPLLSLHGVLP